MSGTATARRLRAAIERLDPACTRLLDAAAWLALPLALLLSLQWPLRDLVQAHARLANDTAQWLFALYTALAVWQATRQDGHLTPDLLARRLWSATTRHRVRQLALLLGVLPFSAFVLWSGSASVWQSLRQAEAFPDTGNPGYFIVRCAMWLLAAALLVQCVLDLIDPELDLRREADA
jgi:TRAP-type mannitol/chloroaromatic compound transport system permease small subunit